VTAAAAFPVSQVLAGGALDELVHADLAIGRRLVVIDQAVGVQHSQCLVHLRLIDRLGGCPGPTGTPDGGLLTCSASI